MKILKILALVLACVFLLGSIGALAAKLDDSGGSKRNDKETEVDSQTETENPYKDNPLTVGEWKYLGKVETVDDIQAEPYKVADSFDVMLGGGLFAYNLQYSDNWGGAFIRIICDTTVNGETETELLYTFTFDGGPEADGITGTFEIAPPEEGAVRSNLRMVVFDDCEYEVYAFEGPYDSSNEKTWFTAGQWMSLGTVPTVNDFGGDPYDVAESFDVMLKGGMFAYTLDESANYGDGKIEIVCTETNADGVVEEVTLFENYFLKDGSNITDNFTYEYDSETMKFIGRIEIEPPAEGVTRSNLRMEVCNGCEFELYAYVG